jgi:hypothetical protein
MISGESAQGNRRYWPGTVQTSGAEKSGKAGFVRYEASNQSNGAIKVPQGAAKVEKKSPKR